MKIEKKLLGMGLLIVAMFISISNGDMLVNCNFARQDGSVSITPNPGQHGILGTSSDVWNNYSMGTTSESLVDSTGASSGLSIVQDAGFSSSWTNAGAIPVLYCFNSTASGVGASVTISGFSGGTYDLYIYNAYVYGSGTATTTYTVNGISESTPNNPTNLTTLVEGENYVVFEDLTPVDGQIVINLSSTGASTITALQLTQVPEPMTMGLLGAGIVGVILKRKKC